MAEYKRSFNISDHVHAHIAGGWIGTLPTQRQFIRENPTPSKPKIFGDCLAVSFAYGLRYIPRQHFWVSQVSDTPANGYVVRQYCVKR